MSGSGQLDAICRHVRSGQGLSLFLDYDGTLVPIGRASAESRPDTDLLDLLAGLARAPTIQTVILSARALASLVALVPIPGIALAGIYGLEVQINGQRVTRGPSPAMIRPILTQVKTEWERRFSGRAGFIIEDKGLAVALHAGEALPAEAEAAVRATRASLTGWLPAQRFRIVGANDYLEVAPAEADKGQTVGWFLDQSRRSDQMPVYFGDDANDDEAFAVVRRHGGIPIGVGSRHSFRNAVEVIASPGELREWLRRILAETGN